MIVGCRTHAGHNYYWTFKQRCWLSAHISFYRLCHTNLKKFVYTLPYCKIILVVDKPYLKKYKFIRWSNRHQTLMSNLRLFISNGFSRYFYRIKEVNLNRWGDRFFFFPLSFFFPYCNVRGEEKEWNFVCFTFTFSLSVFAFCWLFFDNKRFVQIIKIITLLLLRPRALFRSVRRGQTRLYHSRLFHNRIQVLF